MQHPTIRRVLLGVAITGGAWLCLTAADGAAHADSAMPAHVVEHPGGVLGHLLPEQASDRAHQVHGQVVSDNPEPPAAQAPEPQPERTEPPAAPEPTPAPVPPADEPEPVEQPSEEPAPDPVVVDLPTDPIVDVPPVEVPPIAVEVPPVLDTPPVVVETPPVVEPAPTTEPTPAPDPVVITLPAPLPVVIGLAPAAPQPASVVAQLVAELTAAPGHPVDCADQPDDAVHINRDALRALLSIVDKQPTAAGHDRPAKPCPGHPVDPHADGVSTAATNSGHNTGGATNADLAGALAAPALTRLTHARPRSNIPAGRHTAIEPGPA